MQPSRVRRTRSAPISPAHALGPSDPRWGFETQWLHLKPPDTPGVREHIAETGNSTSLLDVALTIVSRLSELESVDQEELLFIRDCLKAGTEAISVPVALLPNALDSESIVSDPVNSFLLSTYSQTPSHKAGKRISRVSFCSDSSSTLRDDAAKEMKEREFGALPQQPRSAPDLPFELSSRIGSQVEELIEAAFDTWAFDTHKLSLLTDERPLQVAGWAALKRWDVFEELSIKPDQARNFLAGVEAAYKTPSQTQYHNRVHGADVVQGVHSLLEEFEFAAFFDLPCTFAMLLSAAVHDMGHDGRNNAFHVNISDELALTYNDRSVLENFHVSQAFKLMASESAADILSPLQKADRGKIRKQMVDIVLSTDMAHHFAKLGTIKAHVEKLGSDPQDWAEDDSATSDLQCFLIHFVDISNPTKPLPMSDLWQKLLQEEFFSQGADEKRLGLPVSPLCSEKTKVASSQVGFLKFIVQPTCASVAELSTKMRKTMLPALTENIEVWEKRKQEEEEEEANHKRREAEASLLPADGSGSAPPTLGRELSGKEVVPPLADGS